MKLIVKLVFSLTIVTMISIYRLNIRFIHYEVSRMQRRYIVKSTIFLIIFIVLLNLSSQLLREKRIWSESTTNESITTWVDEFNNLDENTLDALFLGASHSFCSINPTVLWKNTGVAAYNLGSSAQDVNASKLYLEHALKTQTPKVVFLEARTLLFNNGTKEQWNRLAYDNMPLSLEKINNLKNSILDNESFISYLAPALYYHDRWKELKEEDFKYVLNKNTETHGIMGHYPRYNMTKVSLDSIHENVLGFEGISNDVMNTVNEINDICRNKGIKLVLWKAVTPMWRDDYHYAIKTIADDNNIPFIDLNYSIDEIGIDSERDFFDKNSHLNEYGAIKVTNYWGGYLVNNFSFDNYDKEKSYDNWNIEYQYFLKNYISNQNDINNYLKGIKNNDYTVYFSVNDGLVKVNDDVQNLLYNLGLRKDITNSGVKSYVAIIDNGNLIFEELSDEAIYYNNMINGKQVTIESKGWKVGDDGSIKIDGKEYMIPKQRGLGIVVYDKILNKVVDSVTFDIKDNSKVYR